MKKFLLSALTALLAIPVFANLDGDGFYRVQNAVTKRYAYLTDNRGSFDASTSSADVNALQLWSGFLKASSDPASVFYISNESQAGSNNSYNISGQGTSIHAFLGEYLRIMAYKVYDGKQAYLAYASKYGFTKYLGDLRTDGNDEMGFASADAKGDNRLWYIDPLSENSSDSYFGVCPTVTAGSKYYYPLFAAFPYTAYSEGVKFYIVNGVDAQFGIVILKEIKGRIPGGCGVIVECDHPLATDNRLSIGYGNYADLGGSRLKGVYFDNNTNAIHWNRTPNNPYTMRLLTSVNGKLTFTVSNIEYLPANQCYLLLNNEEEMAVSSYTCMTEAEYMAYLTSLGDRNPDGYYRVQNAGTQRYAALVDNKGSFGADPNVSAFQLCSDFLRESSDPASVFYMSKSAHNNNVTARNLSTQGTSTDAIFNSALFLNPSSAVGGADTYNIVGNSGAGNRYLGDATAAGAEWGSASVSATGNSRMWWIKPLSDSNYLGVTPTATVDGKYYAPFMAGFPVSAASQGVKFFTVTRIDTDFEAMVMKEVTGVIPAGTPVIVQCAGPLASDNRLAVGIAGDAANVEGNLLSAVYFDTEGNRTAYDAPSMRSLAVADGKLVMTPATAAYVARNQAYISLKSDAEKKVTQYSLLTEAEYEAKVAQIAGSLQEGYYRLRNTGTQRTLFMLDDKVTISNTGLNDLKAFQLIADVLRAQSDPACVMKITAGPASGSALDHNIATQGTNFQKVFSSYVKMLPIDLGDGKEGYSLWVTKTGTKKFFGDSAPASDATATLSFTAEGYGAVWNVNAVDDASATDFFGVSPTVTAGGKYYATLMADFPFTAVSDGVKVYGIYKIDTNKKVMVLKEYEGVIPAATPVIILCAGPLPSDNRLAVGAAGAAADVKDNQLKGVWFDFNVDGRVNQTAFDQSSMRVLGEDDGKLVFKKADYTAVPRNQAYMKLEGMRPIGIDQYQVMTEAEYEELGVEAIAADETVDVYLPDGVLLKAGVRKSEVPALGKGLYILRSASSTEKLLVH
ncbi:MAG: hypothetical protein K2K93_06170 [Muribaculaceae bacterium]|nr:hypothetical protein [Muribaculaceae bacterium]